jgi:methyl-accepting chemotaxis protein
MKIATKLVLFFSAIVMLFALLAVVLLAQMRTVTRGYDSLLNGPIRQMEMARVVQVNFKKQVQEWKDILLRGQSPDDLAKYAQQFHGQEMNVRRGAQDLIDVMQDAEARQLLVRFLTAHKVMGDKYQTAYDAYVKANFDYHIADRLVRGQDREATDLFDQVVERLSSDVENSIAAQNAATRKVRNLTLNVFAILLAVLGLGGFFAVRSMLRRLAKLQAAANRLAAADINGLIINISGSDEIGSFCEGMKGVHAALEELTRLAEGAAHLV